MVVYGFTLHIRKLAVSRAELRKAPHAEHPEFGQRPGGRLFVKVASTTGQFPRREDSSAVRDGQCLDPGRAALFVVAGAHKLQQPAQALVVAGGGAGEATGVAAFPARPEGRYDQPAVGGDGKHGGRLRPLGGFVAGDGFVRIALFVGDAAQSGLYGGNRREGQAIKQATKLGLLVAVAGGEEDRSGWVWRHFV